MRTLFAYVWTGLLGLGLAAGTVTSAEPRFVEVSETASIEFTPAKNEDAVPEHFRLKPHRFEAETELLRESGSFRTVAVTFPSPVETAVPENNTVFGEYFQPAGPGPFPGVVVLHDFVLRTLHEALAETRRRVLFAGSLLPGGIRYCGALSDNLVGAECLRIK